MLAIISGSSAFAKPNLHVWKFLIHIQAPLFMRFFRQEYWGGLLFPPPGNLPDSGIKSCISCVSYIEGRFFTQEAIREALNIYSMLLKTSINDQEKKQ